MTSRPKEQCKMLNLASLSSLELIILIDMFVWGWICFVVLCFFQLFYFFGARTTWLLPSSSKSWYFPEEIPDLQGLATSCCKVGLGATEPFIPKAPHPCTFSVRYFFCKEPQACFKRISCLLEVQPWLSRRKICLHAPVSPKELQVLLSLHY